MIDRLLAARWPKCTLPQVQIDSPKIYPTKILNNHYSYRNLKSEKDLLMLALNAINIFSLYRWRKKSALLKDTINVINFNF